MGFTYLAVDCTWSQWEEWTECEEKCPVSGTDGFVHRYRHRINEHDCGGTPCKGDAKESKSCHIISIMKEDIESKQEEINHLKTERDYCQSNVTALHDKLCSLLNCQNEGVCENGVCKCKPGYLGASCEKQKGKSAQPTFVFTDVALK